MARLHYGFHHAGKYLAFLGRTATKSTQVANGPVSTFTPIIIHDLGFSGLNSLLLVMPAGAIIGTIELGTPYIAYKKKGLRSYLVAITVCGTITASFILWLLPQSHTGARLFGGKQPCSMSFCGALTPFSLHPRLIRRWLRCADVVVHCQHSRIHQALCQLLRHVCWLLFRYGQPVVLLAKSDSLL